MKKVAFLAITGFLSLRRSSGDTGDNETLPPLADIFSTVHIVGYSCPWSASWLLPVSLSSTVSNLHITNRHNHIYILVRSKDVTYSL